MFLELPSERSLGDDGPAEAFHLLRGSTLGVRLVVGCAVFFVSGGIVLAGVVYGLTSGFRQNQTVGEAQLDVRLQSYASVYKTGGLRALWRTVEADGGNTELLVRVVEAGGDERYRFNTTGIDASELRQIKNHPELEGGGRLRLEASGEGTNPRPRSVEIASRVLPSGDRLQVGLSATSQAGLLEAHRWTVLGIALLSIVWGLVGGGLVAIRALRPFWNLLGAVRSAVNDEKGEERIAVDHTHGEIAELAYLFNRMLERVEEIITCMHETVDRAAHNLRTPITHLRGRAELALQEDSDVDCREALADVVLSTDRVLAILETMLEVAKVETGAAQLEKEEVLVEDLIEEIVAMYEIIAQEKGLSLDVRMEGGIAVHANPDTVQQTLANLVDNAVTYTSEGGRVVLGVEESGSDVVVRVSDTGPGISPEDLPHVWDRFYRGTPASGDEEPGFGLGLSFVKAVVEAHGGTVDIESRLGEGTAVSFCLPSVKESAPGDSKLTKM